MKKLRDDLITPSDFQRIFGVSRRTAKRWDSDGTRPEIIALARLVKLQDLGAVDPAWTGWVIRRGRLYDPLGSSYRGWQPEHVRGLEYAHDLRRALEREVADLRKKTGFAKERVAFYPGDRRLRDRRHTPRRGPEAAARPRLSATPEP